MQAKLYETDKLRHRNPSGAEVEAIVDELRGRSGEFLTLEAGDLTVQGLPDAKSGWTVQVLVDESAYLTRMNSSDEVKRFLVQVLWGDYSRVSDFGSERVGGHDWTDISRDAFGSDEPIPDRSRSDLKIVASVLGGYLALTLGTWVAAVLLDRADAFSYLSLSVGLACIMAVSVFLQLWPSRHWQMNGRTRFDRWWKASATADRHGDRANALPMDEDTSGFSEAVQWVGIAAMLSLTAFIMGVVELLSG